MPAPQEIVWDTITDSAKRRFDFQSFSATFEEIDDEHVLDNVLFKIIVGLADEQPHASTAADISGDFLLLGFLADKGSFLTFIEDRSHDLHPEIMATQIAVNLFQMGAQPSDVLVQIRSMLSKL